MSKNKLQKFSEVATFDNVYQCFNSKEPSLVGKDFVEVELKGRWHAEHFGNQKPLTLELACGRGEYTVGLAERYPDRNFIGIDIKGARIWKGARQAIDRGLDNAAFLRARIERLEYFFASGEVSELWLTHPDPFLKKPNRRLTSVGFLERYVRLLPAGAPIHLKTDNTELYEYTVEIAESYPQVHLQYHTADIDAHDELPVPELDIPTYYERLHRSKGETIKYVRMTTRPA